MYTIHRIVYIIHCLVYSPGDHRQCSGVTLEDIVTILYSVYYTLYSVQCILYSVYYTVYTIQIHCIVYNPGDHRQWSFVRGYYCHIDQQANVDKVTSLFSRITNLIELLDS